MDIAEIEKFGLANTINGIIYIHPKLQEFPELREKIIRHEIEHQKSKGFWQNRKIDTLSSVRFRELLPFYKKYPKVFLQQYSPITYIEGNLMIEWTLVFTYIFYLLIGLLIFWIINVFSTDRTFFFSVVKNIILIGLGILGIYLLRRRLRDYVNKK